MSSFEFESGAVLEDVNVEYSKWGFQNMMKMEI